MGKMVQGYDRELFNEAVRSARRSERAAESDDSDLSQAGAAAAAIVLAEASLEAFVSETLAILERIGTLSHEARTRVEGKRTFWKQCDALYEELSGEPLNGKKLYDRRLVPLVRLRHCVVHRAANLRPTGAWPEQIEPHRSEIDHVEGEDLHWTSQLLTSRTAAWAVRAALATRQTLHDALPKGSDAEAVQRALSSWRPASESPDVS